ncbi:MAG: DUF4340 domain-containing protein [Limisphaerales bacterium]
MNEVAVIHVEGNGANFNVVHTHNLWSIRERDNYPADYDLVRDFLFKVSALKVVQSDVIGANELARLDLEPPGTGTTSALLVQFKDRGGKLLASLLVGKRHRRPRNDSEPLGLHGLFDGRYVLLPGDPHNSLLVSDDLAAVSPAPGLWLSQDFFKVENVKFISISSPEHGKGREISRADDDSPWTLSNARPGETVNDLAASRLSEILEFPSFDDVARKTPALLASQGLDKPIVITALTDHFAYTLKVGRKKPDGDYPITVNVAGDIPDAAPDAAGLRAKLARERALEPWIFYAGHWVERMLEARDSLVQRSTSAAQTAEK